MSLKPFRPPSFKNPSLKKPENTESSRLSYCSVGESKRRKLSPNGDDSGTDEPAVEVIDQPARQERRPLKALHNPSSPVKPPIGNGAGKKYFSILWRKVTTKKNKTWDDDGVLSYHNGQAVAYTSKGHRIGGLVRDAAIEVDDMLSMSGKDVQIEAEITYEDFCRTIGRDNIASKSESVVIRQGMPLPAATQNNDRKPAKISLQEQMRQQIEKDRKTSQKTASSKPNLPQPRNAAFRQPLKDSQILAQVPSDTPIPRHDPGAPNALVFKRPKRAPIGKQIVDVVLDPILSKHLREHQREGVRFLYECVMDLRNFGGQGCILADDMGLGKTLQTIALIWTLVKQNPIYKDDPVIKKVLIVCPVTLVQNWKKEFRKWLGHDRLGVMSFEDKGSRLSMFDGRNFKVMVVGYERLRTIAEDLTRGAGIDLIVCDEGHRLKTLQNKSAKAIETLNTARRVILSGTPIQNDLNEFFAMVNFVNDGILGNPKAFVKDFEKPIMKSRQPKATEEDIEKGQEASDELARTTSPFILRRTADILSKYLPPKTEYVLFCRPTPEQANVYREVLKTSMFKSALGSHETALQMITILKKLCNSPALLKPQQGGDESTTPNSLQTLNEMLPKGLSRFYHNSYASKIRLLDELLHQIRTTTNDKVVLVSNYTATLNLMENLLHSSGMSFRRLDGSVPNTKRQAMVDEFNRASPATCFAFLLSAKAGGMGINLIGANRLVLFDVDWNPATDDQAMARIHREGQKKSCKIYRFLIKGGLEERIWQRQVVKRGLADSIMESGSTTGVKKSKGKAAFGLDELRDLFRLDETEGLRTHDLISCGCNGKGHIYKEYDDLDRHDEKAAQNKNTDLDTESEDEADKILPAFSITRASRLTDQDLEDQERSISTGSSPRKSPSKRQRKQQEEEMQELLTYTHIDTSDVSKLDGGSKEESDVLDGHEQAIDDPCLFHVLRQGGDIITGNIAYIFTKKSKVCGMDEIDDSEAENKSAIQEVKSISDFMAA
ncbi:helicase [Neophaeococcomyces mojaviensis]|uniref:Helicase n=1 Tax=Neophaeococcomyces mojaviensis TaxID=3383035 RepID=A0ACC3A0I4_9EURO|nr:helicase [Knufia sp. JES_112]